VIASHTPNRTEELKIIQMVLRQPAHRLDQVSRFFNSDTVGGGVYLLHYIGDHPYYQSIRAPQPIYVGQSEFSLRARLGVHLRTLNEIWAWDQSLRAGDFLVKALHLQLPGWGLLVEKSLMSKFNPWWNRKGFLGFGNDGSRGPKQDKQHTLDPNLKRQKGGVADWDVIHRGRKKAEKFARPSEEQALIQAELAVRTAEGVDFLAKNGGTLDMFRVQRPFNRPRVRVAAAPAKSVDILELFEAKSLLAFAVARVRPAVLSWESGRLNPHTTISAATNCQLRVNSLGARHRPGVGPIPNRTSLGPNPTPRSRPSAPTTSVGGWTKPCGQNFWRAIGQTFGVLSSTTKRGTSASHAPHERFGRGPHLLAVHEN
jgi:hypothetical protein